MPSETPPATPTIPPATSRLAERYRPEGITDKFILNIHGDPLRHIDPLSRKTDYSYNADGDMTLVVYPDRSSRAYSYHPTWMPSWKIYAPNSKTLCALG